MNHRGLKSVAAAAIRLVRFEADHMKLLDDNITKHTTVPLILKRWEKLVAARRELKEAVSKLKGA